MFVDFEFFSDFWEKMYNMGVDFFGFLKDFRWNFVADLQYFFWNRSRV